MSDVIFIQFYKENWEYLPYTETILQNGLSYVYDDCKKMGDMIWLRHTDPFPIKVGKAFVSAFTTNDVFTTFEWADQYPEVEFVIGGPAAMIGSSYSPIPPNVKLSKASAEKEIFGLNTRHTKWEIEPPPTHASTYYASFIVSSYCYWGKCIFCLKLYRHDNLFYSPVTSLNLPDNGNRWRIFLLTSSATPDIIKILPELPPKVWKISTFLRADSQSREALEPILPSLPDGFARFLFGIEFPSNRMLQMMNKGVTVDDCLQSINQVRTHKQSLCLNFLLGWNVLTEQDIRDLETFFVNLGEKPQAIINYLTYGEFTINHKGQLGRINGWDYRELKASSSNGKFTKISWAPVLTPDQRELNEIARQIIEENTIITLRRSTVI